MFAKEFIANNEILIVWSGSIYTADEALRLMSTEDKHYILQIGDGYYQAPLDHNREAADFTNHSCEPNSGFGHNSPICLSAMRDI